MSFDKVTGAGVPDNSGYTTNKNDTVKTGKSMENLHIGEKLKGLSKEQIDKLAKQADDYAKNESNKSEKPDTEKKLELSDISKKISAMSDEEIEQAMKTLDDEKSSKTTQNKKLTIEEMEAALESKKAEIEKQLNEKGIDDFLRHFISEAELKTLNSTQKRVLMSVYNK